jgi:hypothetical protein
MERTFLETVHFLGLDMEMAVVAVMAALQAMRGLAERSWARRKASRPTVRTALPSVTAAWPPSGWRSSH